MGKFTRLGQQRDGTACGAACGALSFCSDCNNTLPTNESLGANPADYQMQYLISKIAEVKDTILSKEDENARQAELAKQTYLIAQVLVILNLLDVLFILQYFLLVYSL